MGGLGGGGVRIEVVLGRPASSSRGHSATPSHMVQNEISSKLYHLIFFGMSKDMGGGQP